MRRKEGWEGFDSFVHDKTALDIAAELHSKTCETAVEWDPEAKRYLVYYRHRSQRDLSRPS